jgi:hypothetical protein
MPQDHEKRSKQSIWNCFCRNWRSVGIFLYQEFSVPLCPSLAGCLPCHSTPPPYPLELQTHDKQHILDEYAWHVTQHILDECVCPQQTESTTAEHPRNEHRGSTWMNKAEAAACLARERVSLSCATWPSSSSRDASFTLAPRSDTCNRRLYQFSIRSCKQLKWLYGKELLPSLNWFLGSIMLLLHWKEKDCLLFDQLASGQCNLHTIRREFFLNSHRAFHGIRKSENPLLWVATNQIEFPHVSNTSEQNTDAPTTIQRNSPSRTQKRAQRGDYQVGIRTREKHLAQTTSVRREGKTDSLFYTFQFMINKFSGRPGDDVPERIASFQLPVHSYAPHTAPPPFMKTPMAAVSVSVSENRA